MNNQKFDHEEEKHNIDYKACIKRMNSTEAADNEYFPPEDNIQRKIDFFFLPYNKDMKISKGIVPDEHEDACTSNNCFR